MHSQVPAIFFDLDGTLIDSAQSILDALAHACHECEVIPACPLTKNLIGPPLSQIAALLTGKENIAAQKNIIQAFKAVYDAHFCTQVETFPGVELLLRHLYDTYNLYIATNKRKIPTERIISSLGWKRFFTGIYSPDSIEPPAVSKKSLLSRLLTMHSLHAYSCIYIGDTLDDKNAAEENAVQCLLVNYGYGNIPDNFTTYSAAGISQYITSIKRIKYQEYPCTL